MRKITSKKPNLQEQAMKQLRKTRDELERQHPELMQRLQILARAQHRPTPDTDVSKDKNIEAVLGFLEIKGDSAPGLKTAVKAILAKHVH